MHDLARPPRRMGVACRAARCTTAFATVALAVALIPTGTAAQEVGAVGGRIIDSESSEPVSGVVVTITGVEPVLTGPDGVFTFPAVPVGERELIFEHLAYGSLSRHVLVSAGAELTLEAVISTRAIELTPLVVEALSELEQRRISSGSAINELTLPEIDRAVRSGLNLSQLLEMSMPGVDVRPGSGGQTCVQYRAIRTGNNLGDCDGVSVLLDGIPVADPSYIYSSLPLRDIERVEMISPGQAGVRYGMRSGQSVLLIETKQAVAARQSDLSNLVTGFDWSQEQQPYGWLRVFGGAFVANAIGVGVGLALADRCFWTPDTSQFALRTRCKGVTTASASILSVALPSIGGALIARWGGQTDRSRGRLVPSMVTTGMILTGGYLLMIGGDGDLSRSAGAAVLTIAAPLSLTISDRIFRVLR